MSIHFHEDLGIFHLQSDRSSYVIELVRGVYPAHAYWGRRIRDNRVLGLLERREEHPFADAVSRGCFVLLDSLPQEYPGYGSGDFRQPAYQVQLANGTTVTEAEYVRHRIYSGKPKLEGLPAVYTEQDDEADTLELELVDRVSGLTIYLSYTVMKAFDAISRSVSFRNDSKENMTLLRAMSASVDMDHSRYDLLHLHGAWARAPCAAQKTISRHAGHREPQGSSSHNHNPFLALLSEGQAKSSARCTASVWYTAAASPRRSRWINTIRPGSRWD